MGAALSRRRFRWNRSPQTGTGLRPLTREDFVDGEEPLQETLHEHESSSQLGSCLVCDEVDLNSQFPPSTPTSKCSHPINICLSCLETYVCTKVEDGILRIICPAISCRKYLDGADVQAALAENRLTFERFCEQKLWATLRTETNFFRCKAPGCSSGQIHTGGVECPIVICEACSARACFVHDAPWHEGKTCAEYNKHLKLSPKRARQVKKSEKWVKSKTKACPGEGCGRPIEKNNGCDHMVCREPGGCGHEFCWQCMAPYGPILDQGSSLHNPDCRYHGLSYNLG